MAAWVDGGTYLYADNTNKMRLTDAGALNLSIAGDGAVPGANGVYGAPYASSLFNIVDASSDTSVEPALAVQKTVNHTNAASATFPASGLFSTWHNNGAANVVCSLAGTIVSQKTSVSGVNDSVAVHGHAIKTPTSVNHAYGMWAYCSRQSTGTDTILKGNLHGTEINIHNGGSKASTVNGLTNTYTTNAVTGGSVYVSEGFGARDSFDFNVNKPWSSALHIGHADTQVGETIQKCDAAISIMGDSLVGVPVWYNGITFFGNSIATTGTALNIAAATPLYGVKFGAVASGGAHLCSLSNDLKIKVGANTTILGTDGVLTLAGSVGQVKSLDTSNYKGAGALRTSAATATTTGAATALNSLTRLATGGSAVSFGWHTFSDGGYLCIYVDTLEVARIKNGKIIS